MSFAYRPLFAIALLATPALAQQPPLAPLVLLLPGGTRAAGMGNSFAAGRGAEVLFYNPAQIGVIRGSTVSLARFGSAATLGTFSTVGPFGRVALGAGVQYLDYETPPGPDFFIRPAQLPVGSTLASSSLAAEVAASTRIKGIRVGVGAKYVQERVGVLGDGGLAIDMGMAREVDRATVGFAVQNIGSGPDVPHIKRASLPTRLSLAVASPTILVGTYFDLVAMAGVSRERDGRIVPAGGVELVYQPLAGWSFVGRAGVRRVEGGPAPLESPVTLGGSFGLDRFWLDYVYQPSRGSGATHRIGIRVQ